MGGGTKFLEKLMHNAKKQKTRCFECIKSWKSDFSKNKKHQIYTIKQNKVALNEDDKEEYKRYTVKVLIEPHPRGKT